MYQAIWRWYFLKWSGCETGFETCLLRALIQPFNGLGERTNMTGYDDFINKFNNWYKREVSGFLLAISLTY